MRGALPWTTIKISRYRCNYGLMTPIGGRTDGRENGSNEYDKTQHHFWRSSSWTDVLDPPCPCIQATCCGHEPRTIIGFIGFIRRAIWQQSNPHIIVTLMLKAWPDKIFKKSEKNYILLSYSFVRQFVRQQFNSILSIISFILLFLVNFVDITLKIRVFFSSEHKFFERFFFKSSENSFV